MREPGDLRAQRQRDALVGLHREDQLVGLHADGALGLEREVRHRLELDGDLGDLAREPLARAQHDRHARPSASCGPPGAAPRRSRSASRRGRRPPRGSPWPPRRRTTPAVYCARTVHGGDLLGRRRRDRLEHLDLLVAHLVGLEGRRRLHAHEREQLQHVVLDQVAQRARLVVVARPRADPDVLGGRDLDVVDEVAVPDRLEHVVGEPERHHVLDGLLAQVVVDAVDLLLAEGATETVFCSSRADSRSVPNGFSMITRTSALAAVVEVRLLERARDHPEELRRGREVERAVERVALALERVERLRRACRSPPASSNENPM